MPTDFPLLPVLVSRIRRLTREVSIRPYRRFATPAQLVKRQVRSEILLGRPADFTELCKSSQLSWTEPLLHRYNTRRAMPDHNGRYILDDARRVVSEPDLITWALWLETADRIVRRDA